MEPVRRHIDAVRLRELDVRGSEPGDVAGSCLEEEFVD